MSDVLKNPDTGVPNSNYANGHYQLRYRRSSGDHTSTTWTPGQFELPPNADFGAPSNPHTISEIELQSIYAVQLIYRDDTNNSHDADVFAARNVYVWPSFTAPADGSTVATFPLRTSLQNSRFLYRICGNSFGPPSDQRRADWEALIHGALQQWSHATNGLVSFGRVLLPCTTDEESGIGYNKITEEIKSKLEGGGIPPDEELLDNVLGYVEMLRSTGVIKRLYDENVELSEILMYDDISLGELVTVGAFLNMATDIGYWDGCWFDENDNYSPANMCTNSVGQTVDIIVRRGAYDAASAGLTSPYFTQHVKRSTDDELELPASNERFNMCLNDSDTYGSAFQDMVHEIGHVLGISHPSIPDSVVNYDHDPAVNDLSEPDCSPHPFDVMAVFALYQTGFGAS